MNIHLGIPRLNLTVARVKMIRLIGSCVAVLIAAGLIYLYVWRALYQDVTLPAGISGEDPALNMPVLQQLNQERLDRVRTSSPSFESSSTVFSQ